ncbi:MAG TPA: T9SS type A sorting domain-containing protein, partial [Bacteroidia bacterium]|nr:T9SS type A sorting domain-containing protein [Bacteroidia bacterium]
MKKQTTKGILLSILFASMYLQTMSQNICITNQFNFGGSENDAPVSIIKIADGYVMCGYTNSHDGNFNVPHNHGVDAFIAKFDFNNNLIWQHTYGGKNYDDLWSIKSTDDGGFIAAGETSSNEHDVSGNHGGKYDVWVVKFNSLGILQWQRCYGGKGSDEAYEIHVVPGGYQVVGYTSSNNNGDVQANHGGYDAWLLTISSSGNVVSSYCYGGSGYDEMSGISRNNNGTSTFNAYTESNDGQVSGNHGGLSDVWLVNIDNNNGNILWQKCIGGSRKDNPHTIARTADGNIVLSITSGSRDGDFIGSTSGCALGTTAILMKVNPETGAIIWNRNYPNPNRCTAPFGTLVTTDGGILVMGLITENIIESNHDGRVFKVDADGNMLWDIILGGSKSENVIYWKTGIEINNQYLIPFTSKSHDGDILNPLGGADGWMVTLGTGCSQGLATEIENILSNEVAIPKHQPHELAVGETESNLSNEVAIFPNPVTNTTTISFSLPQTGNVSVKIFDGNGRLVKTLANSEFAKGNHYVEWNAT